MHFLTERDAASHLSSSLLTKELIYERLKSISMTKVPYTERKFCPWICLCQLDFVATVSFRRYGVIRCIEFSGLELAQYKRGLFHNRQQLSRLSKMLEVHGKELLPYDIMSNSVKFDLTHPVPWLLNNLDYGSMSREES